MTTGYKGKVIGYIRVSSLDQNTSRQEEQLQGFNYDEVYIDKASGKDVARPQLQLALKDCRKGDTLIVSSMDRLARNLDDLRRLVSELTGKSVTVQFIKEGMIFTGEENHIAKLMLSIMGAFAEFERSLIKERQMEGIAIAKTNGVYKGRKPTLTPPKVQELLNKDKQNQHKNRAALAREFGISRETFYQYLRLNKP